MGNPIDSNLSRPFDVNHSFTSNDPIANPGVQLHHFWNVTQNHQLMLPDKCARSWADSINWNFKYIDSLLGSGTGGGASISSGYSARDIEFTNGNVGKTPWYITLTNDDLIQIDINGTLRANSATPLSDEENNINFRLLYEPATNKMRGDLMSSYSSDTANAAAFTLTEFTVPVTEQAISILGGISTSPYTEAIKIKIDSGNNRLEVSYVTDTGGYDLVASIKISYLNMGGSTGVGFGQYITKIERTANVALANDPNNPTILDMTSSSVDTMGGANISQNRIIPTKAGYYLFVGRWQLNAPVPAATDIRFYVLKNGSTRSNEIARYHMSTASSEEQPEIVATTIEYMNGVSDYVQLGYEIEAAGQQDVGCWLECALVGETGVIGSGLPVGGTIGQMIRKKSATDGDVEWSGALTIANDNKVTASSWFHCKDKLEIKHDSLAAWDWALESDTGTGNLRITLRNSGFTEEVRATFVEQNDPTVAFAGLNLHSRDTASHGLWFGSISPDAGPNVGTYTSAYDGIRGVPNLHLSSPNGIYSNKHHTFFDGSSGTSDVRLKENVKDIADALNTVCNLRGVTFNWKKDKNNEKKYGFVAQELQQHLPDLVKKDDKGYLSVDYMATTAVLAEAIKELKAEVEELKSELTLG